MLSDKTNTYKRISNESIKFYHREQKGKHLTYEECIKLEALHKMGLNPSRIAEQIGGRSERTIRRDIAKGMVVT